MRSVARPTALSFRTYLAGAARAQELWPGASYDAAVPTLKAVLGHDPGEEISYIMDGKALLLIDGQPPRRVKAGESFVIPAGVVHDAHNDTNSPTKLVGVFVVEKGKPLATPAR